VNSQHRDTFLTATASEFDFGFIEETPKPPNQNELFSPLPK
jgi:hypothetical protein